VLASLCYYRVLLLPKFGMADPEGDSARYWSPELRAAVQAFGYALSDEDILLRQEAEAVQAAADFEGLANQPPVLKKRKKVKIIKKRKKSHRTPAEAVQEPYSPGKRTSGLQLQPASPPTYTSVVQESQARKRPASTITSPLPAGDSKLQRLTLASAPDQSCDAVQNAVKNLLAAMQCEQSDQSAQLELDAMLAPFSPAVSVDTMSRSVTPSVISCTATDRPTDSQADVSPRRVRSESAGRAYSVISNIPHRPVLAARSQSPLPSSLGRSSSFSESPRRADVRGTSLHIPPFAAKPKIIPLLKRKLPMDDYSPPRDPRQGAAQSSPSLDWPNFRAPKEASGPLDKVVVPDKAVDKTRPPPFKIPRKSAPSATAAGRLGDLLSAMLKTSGFSVPTDPGLPLAGPPAPKKPKPRPTESPRDPPPGRSHMPTVRPSGSQSGASNYDSSYYYLDSVSQSGDRSLFPDPPEDALAGFSGLEGFLGVGVQRALPKPSRGLAPPPKAEVLWEHMRGMLTGRDKDHLVKSTEIARKYQSDSATAFRPPPVPHQIFLDKSEKASDTAMQTKQRSYGIPAHILASLAIDMEQSAIIHLKEASLMSTGVAKQRIEQALEFLQQSASLEIGYALRHLATHFNEWAIKRRDSVLKAKGVTDELSAALTHEKLGFKTFWNNDITPMVTTANQAASIRMLAQHLKAKPAPRAQAKNPNPRQNNQGGDKKAQPGGSGNSGNAGSNNKNRKRNRGRGKGKGKSPAPNQDKAKNDK
jgi:hypothetical protein